MQTASTDLINLETRFWQAMVDEDADTAVALLDEPALMVSEHGAMKFDRDDYRRMAAQGPMVIKSFQLSDMDVTFPNEDTAIITYRVRQSVAKRDDAKATEQEMADSSVWTRKNGQWLCAIHTETPANAAAH
jgi:ketosteroid isomerase-like protein